MNLMPKYNNSKNNLFGLSDEEIEKIYRKIEHGYNEHSCCYLVHKVKTLEDFNDPDFLKNSVVQTVNKELINPDFIKLMINDSEMESILEKMEKMEKYLKKMMKDNIVIKISNVNKL